MSDKKIEDMSPEELTAYEESLNKEIKMRELKKKQSTLDAEKLEESKQAEEEKAKEQKALWEEEFYKEHPEYVKPKITGSDTIQNTSVEDDKMQKYYNSYKKRNDEFESQSQYVHKKDEIDKVRFQIRNNGKWDECGFDGLFGNTNSDSGCDDDVSAWSPADVYSKIIWETFVCKADLLKICVKGLAINPGDGLGVQIRTYGAFGDPTQLGACECASCASISFSNYSLTLHQYNMEAVICDMDIWDVGSRLMDAYLKSMADAWARWFDEQIYAQLETATPGTTQASAATIACTGSLGGSCCTDQSLLDLYNAVNRAVASMREGNGLAGPYSPDYIILSPSVAEIFKRMQEPTVLPWMQNFASFDSDGRLSRLGGLKVIEYCGANSCTDAAAEVVAIIIDSRRAVGCVFGQRPKVYKEFQQNCNSYRIDQWAYVAFGELDTDAICHITNP